MQQWVFPLLGAVFHTFILIADGADIVWPMIALHRHLAVPWPQDSSLRELHAILPSVADGSGEDDDKEVSWVLKDTLIGLYDHSHNAHGTTFAHVVWRNREKRLADVFVEYGVDINRSVVVSDRMAKARQA